MEALKTNNSRSVNARFILVSGAEETNEFVDKVSPKNLENDHNPQTPPIEAPSDHLLVPKIYNFCLISIFSTRIFTED